MDDAEVAAAYEEYGGAVYARCLRLLRDGDRARDVTQEVFVRCFGHRGRLRVGRELLGWLYRVATNLCLNAIRDRQVQRQGERRAAPHSSVTSAEEASRRTLRDLLEGLDERTQTIVVLVHVDGMTQAEAAEVAQVSDRTVRNCLARFQRQGRERFGHGRTPAATEGIK